MVDLLQNVQGVYSKWGDQRSPSPIVGATAPAVADTFIIPAGAESNSFHRRRKPHHQRTKDSLTKRFDSDETDTDDETTPTTKPRRKKNGFVKNLSTSGLSAGKMTVTNSNSKDNNNSATMATRKNSRTLNGGENYHRRVIRPEVDQRLPSSSRKNVVRRPSLSSRTMTMNSSRTPGLTSSNMSTQSSLIAAFKTSPTTHPNFSGRRPYMGTCCIKCLSGSRKAFVDDAIMMLGIHNILLVPEMNPENNYFVKRFHYLSHVLKKKAGFIYPEVSSEVIDHERVVEAVELAVAEELEEGEESAVAGSVAAATGASYAVLLQKHANRARAVLRSMRASMSTVLIRIVYWTVFKVLSKLVLSVSVHKGQMQVLKKASESSYPLIFLPTHRSHLDYILVTWIMVNNEIRAPLVAAGDNLRIPIIGSLLRGLGAFFIKRKLDPKIGKKDHVYRAILHTYMEKCLAAGHSLEFFIEGGRSRTGKMCIPKVGILSVVMDAYMDGVISDAYICPVNINYDKLLDGNFVSEQLGNPKVMESLWSTVKAMWRLVNRRYGHVRVDFLQPFSLKEFVQSAQMYTNVKRNQMSSNAVGATASQEPHDLRRLSSTASLYGTDVVKEDYRPIVKVLAEHVSYDLSHATALTSTNLLSFLLLHKYRKGATFQQAVHGVTWLREELKFRGRDVAFTGDVAAVVEHALELLGPDLVEQQVLMTSNTTAPTTKSASTSGNNGRKSSSSTDLVVLKPATELPHVIELSYYSNVVLSVFVMDSVIANAIYALVDEEDLSTIRDLDSSRATISRERLVEKAETLCDILQFDFIFAPPCDGLNCVVNDTIDRFITMELLQSETNSVADDDDDDDEESAQKRIWANKIARSFTFNSDSEEDDAFYVHDSFLKLNLNEESLELLGFYRGILSPLIESYWLVAVNLNLLVQTQVEESEFLKQTRLSICSRIVTSLVFYNECLSSDALKNAIKLFENWNVVESSTYDRIKLLYLTEEYNEEDKLTNIVRQIEEFKK